MLLTTKAIILKKRIIGESDKILTLLSEDLGIIEVIIRNFKSNKGNLAKSSEVLSFCVFYLYKSKDRYLVNSIEVIESFFKIRKNIESLSLCLYFCEIIIFLKPSFDNSSIYLKIILNCLHFISIQKKHNLFYKFLLELRFMSMSGFMPDLVACNNCGIYEHNIMHFDINNSIIICDNCILNYSNEKSIKKIINISMIKALRYVVYSDINKLFNFNLNYNILKYLSYISELYLIVHTENDFKSLKIYKSLILEDDDGGLYGKNK